MNKLIIAPSLLAADFRNLEREFQKINDSASEWVHFDVMDGVNVPNISFGFPILEATRTLTDKFIDVHLMIENPSNYFEEFKKYGADGITIHFENNQNLERDLKSIRALNMKSGLVINPDTEVSCVAPYLADCDLILIMSVVPGFGGQKFIENTYSKVKEARELIDKSGYDIRLQVDGGVSVQNASQLRASGADVLVCGSAVFKAPDFSEYIAELMK